MRMNERLTALGWDAFFQEHFLALQDTELIPARVVGVQKTSFRVHTGVHAVPAVPAGLLLHPGADRSAYPAIGDWVAIRMVEADDKAVVTNVLPRKTRFSRALNTGTGRNPGAAVEQIIATNIDYVFIVTALDEDYSLRRIERYVAAVVASGAQPVLVLNKADLQENPERFQAEVEAIVPDIPVHAISGHTEDGVEALRGYFRAGTTVALIGSSGVGKSTLTNRLLGANVAATGAVREDDGKGRHTTTSRELYVLPTGGVLIDNPGLREIAAWTEEVEDAFDDIQALALQCRFRGCTHSTEPGCAVQNALVSGELDADRLRNFQQLQNETSQLGSRATQAARPKKLKSDDRQGQKQGQRGKKTRR